MERVSPTHRVQVILALVARALVDEHGLRGKEAAERLYLAPSAVSQYLNGRRLGREVASVGALPAVRRSVRALARELARSPSAPEELAGRLLTVAAETLASSARGGHGGSPAPAGRSALDPGLGRRLRRRIAVEQEAVAACMRLAQKARDEYTRAVFRQIASDSLRHAEIVATLTPILDRGVPTTYATGITREDVLDLIERERRAEERSSVELGEEVGGVATLLTQSMEADERKHEALLEGMLRLGFAPPRRGHGR
ncbi:MAG TPA: hypothetical protein VFF67_01770 [Thermoplasmata archaeon]|nr:hypothetical protein [Thermoplasmata archaeon]